VDGPIAISVVVASHGRHLRLRWLLNALEEQTLERGRWEVVVVHDYDSATSERVIERHPLSEAGTLRAIGIAAGTGSPARQRNLGWRAAAGSWSRSRTTTAAPSRRGSNAWWLRHARPPET
jgi:hypothetical protein